MQIVLLTLLATISIHSMDCCIFGSSCGGLRENKLRSSSSCDSSCSSSSSCSSCTSQINPCPSSSCAPPAYNAQMSSGYGRGYSSGGSYAVAPSNYPSKSLSPPSQYMMSRPMQPPPNYNAGPMQPPPSYNANSMPSLSSSFYSQPNTPIYNPENPQSGGSPPPAFFNYPSPENLPTPQGSPPNSPPQFPLSPQSPVSDLSIEMSPLKGDDREYTSPTNPPYAAPSPPPYIKTRTATSQVSPAENPEEDFDSDTFDNAVERGGPNEEDFFATFSPSESTTQTPDSAEVGDSPDFSELSIERFFHDSVGIRAKGRIGARARAIAAAAAAQVKNRQQGKIVQLK